MIRVCRWCGATEADVDFLGRLCDDNPRGDEHEMTEAVFVGEGKDPFAPQQCFECETPVEPGFRLCTRHYVESKS